MVDYHGRVSTRQWPPPVPYSPYCDSAPRSWTTFVVRDVGHYYCCCDSVEFFLSLLPSSGQKCRRPWCFVGETRAESRTPERLRAARGRPAVSQGFGDRRIATMVRSPSLGHSLSLFIHLFLSFLPYEYLSMSCVHRLSKTKLYPVSNTVVLLDVAVCLYEYFYGVSIYRFDSICLPVSFIGGPTILLMCASFALSALQARISNTMCDHDSKSPTSTYTTTVVHTNIVDSVFPAMLQHQLLPTLDCHT